jgi:hypothetical protein
MPNIASQRRSTASLQPSSTYNGPVTKKKPKKEPRKEPATYKNNWIKIRADAETKELFKHHASEEKMPLTIWATYHLMEYIRMKPRRN